jgi:hypothetical protein
VSDDRPNLIERLENLIAALDEAHAHIENELRREAHDSIEDAEGIAGEVLTMIDGR